MCSPSKQIFPHPTKHEDVIWNGKEFVGKPSFEGVLAYSMPNAPTGWDDNLTDFHEEISNGRHPIDEASFITGIANIKKYCPNFKQGGGGRLIEIGCSSGVLLRRMRRLFPNAQIVGADIINKTLRKLSKELKKENIPTPLLCFDLIDCPLPDKSYDAVLALNVLEHIKDHSRAVQEIHRILKPGGVFIFEVPYGEKLFDTYDAQLHHYRRYSNAQILKLLNESGLERVYFSHLGFFLYPFFLCVKKTRARWHITAAKQQSICNSRLSIALIALTSGFIVRMILKIELMLGKVLSYPFGIRCIGVFKKPEV
ncbi:MAG: class I SAM-dependent methyltransferase [Holosporaceae bacterium]|nr:class I SAM-dependent methyltransferase [Holosporaceae bacterium]